MTFTTLPQVDIRESFMIGLMYSAILFTLIIEFWSMMTGRIKELENEIGEIGEMT